MEEELVRYDVSDGVALLTFNRPDKLNAMNLAMEEAYYDALDRADADSAVRAIVVTGEGKGFCPGADLEVLQTDELFQFVDPTRRSMAHALTIRKPIVGAINGAIAGMGLAHALMFDVRFIAEGVKLTFSFPQRGLVAEYACSWTLPRLVGTGRALDLLLSGRVVTSDEALALGLVNRTVPGESLLDEALAYAGQLATSCSPTAMATIKAQIWGDFDRPLDEVLPRTRELMEQAFRGPDLAEGVQSFLEKRPPAFPPLAD